MNISNDTRESSGGLVLYLHCKSRTGHHSLDLGPRIESKRKRAIDEAKPRKIGLRLSGFLSQTFVNISIPKNENPMLLSVRGSSDQTIALPSLFNSANAEEILPHAHLTDKLPRLDCGEPPNRQVCRIGSVELDRGKYAGSVLLSYLLNLDSGDRYV